MHVKIPDTTIYIFKNIYAVFPIFKQFIHFFLKKQYRRSDTTPPYIWNTLIGRRSLHPAEKIVFFCRSAQGCDTRIIEIRICVTGKDHAFFAGEFFDKRTAFTETGSTAGRRRPRGRIDC